MAILFNTIIGISLIIKRFGFAAGLKHYESWGKSQSVCMCLEKSIASFAFLAMENLSQTYHAAPGEDVDGNHNA